MEPGPSLVFSESPTLYASEFFDSLYNRGEKTAKALVENAVHLKQMMVGGIYSDFENSISRYGWALKSEEVLFSVAGMVMGRLHLGKGTAVKAGLPALLHSLPRTDGTMKISLVLAVPDNALVKLLTNKSPIGIQWVKHDDFNLLLALHRGLETLWGYDVTYASNEDMTENQGNIKAVTSAGDMIRRVDNMTTMKGVPPSCYAHVS